jgi:putative spermidine/putrescine transport system ATP-binding protein
MEHGRIKQVDAPYKLYEHPATPFISSFVGKMNRLAGLWRAGGVEVAGHVLPCEGAGLADGDAAVLSIRPEKIALMPAGQGQLDGRVKGRFFLGSFWFLHVETSAGTVGVSLPNLGAEPACQGDAVALVWTTASARAEKITAELPAAVQPS